MTTLDPDPFGEQPQTMWKRVWRWNRSLDSAPKRYSVAASILGVFLGLVVSSVTHGLDGTNRALILSLIAATPSLAVEVGWRVSARRRERAQSISPDASDPGWLTSIANWLESEPNPLNVKRPPD